MTSRTENTADGAPLIPASELLPFVTKFFNRRDAFLNLTGQHGSPLYVLEPAVLKNRAEQFRKAFESRLPKTAFFFAMKSNNLPEVSDILSSQGFGLDVSGGPELAAALGVDPGRIVFSGPGKTDAELELAVRNSDRVTLLLDSIGEFRRLVRILDHHQTTMTVGIRLTNNPEGLWRKFGILPSQLLPFFREIEACSTVRFSGLQFHSSWNLVPDRQIAFLHDLADRLQTMPADFLNRLEFIDIGGGYWPPQGEWLITDRVLEHIRLPATPLDTVAERLSRVITDRILSLADCRICFEPGRWLVNDAMHILVQVIDRKADDLVITDAGTNAVGWERFETDYFPVLNLSRPAMTERPCHILGSLCTPHDVWGYAVFGDDIQEGDVLLIPTQGAYTYSLRQTFIKPLPRVVMM